MARQKSNARTGRWRRIARGPALTSALVLVAAAACRGTAAVETEQRDTLSAAGIEVRATGGIAALDLHATIDSVSGQALLTTRPICAPSSECRDLVPPSQRILDPSAVEAFFARTAAPAFVALRADYGTTPNGADMRTYLVTIRANGRVRTLRGDDGSLPALLSAFVSDVLNAPRAGA